MLKSVILDLLNKQVNAELRSAYIYLSMSLHAEYCSFEGMSNWFYIQWLEELEHSRILQKYIISQDSRVVLETIEEVPATWTTPLMMFEHALIQERHITKQIGIILETAFVEKDYATLSKMQWFVDEQVEEEASINSIISRLRYYEEKPFAIYGIDKDLMMRKYTPLS